MEFDGRLEFKSDGVAEVDDFGAMVLPDRREAARQISVRLAAKIVVAGREFLCRVHNISPGGAKIETRANLLVGNEISIEFRSNLSFAGTVRWKNGAYAGIEFDSLANLDAVLKKSGVSIARIKPRLPRYSCKVPAKLESELQITDCETVDISPNGVRHAPCKTASSGRKPVAGDRGAFAAQGFDGVEQRQSGRGQVPEPAASRRIRKLARMEP